MKRPNLVNPQNWTPFRSVPINYQNISIPPVSSTTVNSVPVPVPVPVENIYNELPVRMSREEVIQKNSVYLNFIGLIILMCVFYFLYSIY